MKQKFINLYMDWACRTAQLSYAKRLQVGAVIVKDDCVISYGYNGMPAGWDNNCENETVEMYTGLEGSIHRTVLKTKSEVLHAESNAIAKLAKQGGGGLSATLFITHSPCIECAKLIYQAGIKCVYYRENYRNDEGIEFLRRSNVFVEQVLDN